MPEPKLFLPPHIGKWLASNKPTLREKAEAALRAAEPDANDLLFEQMEREQKNAAFMYLLSMCLAQIPFQVATGHNHSFKISFFCLAMMVMLPSFILASRVLTIPAVNRYNATSRVLAQRGDIRALPTIVTLWHPRQNNKDSFATDTALLALLQQTVPGETRFTRDQKAKDPWVLLRAQFNSLLIKRKGEWWFRAASIATPDKVQIWLALLSHLATDTNAKGRVLLRRVADAHALTLDEDVIRNTARALLEGIPVEAIEEPASVSTATHAPTETWKPTETRETPTLLQRLGER